MNDVTSSDVTVVLVDSAIIRDNKLEDGSSSEDDLVLAVNTTLLSTTLVGNGKNVVMIANDSTVVVSNTVAFDVTLT